MGKIYLITFLTVFCLLGCSRKVAQLSADCFDASRAREGVCPMNYNPVCGCDGKTYSNSCVASQKGILSWEKGACAESK